MAKLEVTANYRVLIDQRLIASDSILAEKQLRNHTNQITMLYGAIRQLWRVTTAFKAFHRNEDVPPGKYVREHFEGCVIRDGVVLNECYLTDCLILDCKTIFNTMVCNTVEGSKDASAR
jgi:hypothetical protein